MNYTEILFKVIPKHEMESVLQCPKCWRNSRRLRKGVRE